MMADPRHEDEARWLCFYKKNINALETEGVKPSGLDVLSNAQHAARAIILAKFVRVAMKRRPGQAVRSRRHSARPF